MFNKGGTFYKVSITPLNIGKVVILDPDGKMIDDEIEIQGVSEYNGPKLYMVGSVYYDNVYFNLLYLTCAFFGLYLPFTVRLAGWKRPFKYISFLTGAVYAAGLVTELINLYYPEIVLNSKDDNGMSIQVQILLTIGITFTLIEEIWRMQKNTE